MFKLRNILLFVLFSLLFGYLIYFTPAPTSWMSAPTSLILIFFVLLVAVVTTLANIFLNYLPKSFVIGLGFLMLSVQLTLGSLNHFTATLIILATGLLFWFIPKKSLTRSPKIPKLTLGRRQKGHSEMPHGRRRIPKLKI